MNELEEYREYMNTAKEKCDILWRYHEIMNEIDNLIKIKKVNHEVKDMFKRNPKGLFIFLQNLPEPKIKKIKLKQLKVGDF